MLTPGGQTLTKELTFEYGTSHTTTKANTQSVEIGGEIEKLIKLIKFQYKHEWSTTDQKLTEQKTSNKLTVSVPPGQKAIISQWKGNFGDQVLLRFTNEIEIDIGKWLKKLAGTFAVAFADAISYVSTGA
jgi:hypothetical protein